MDDLDHDFTGRDMADLTDDAIQEAFGNPAPAAKFPPHYMMTPNGLIWEKGSDKDGVPDLRKIAGPFEVLAMTRDIHSESWGALISWRDADGKLHQFATPRSMLAGDGREIRAALLSGGLYVSSATADRNALNTFLMQVTIDRRARAVSRVGWCDGSFALPDRTISAPGADLVVYQGTAALNHDFRTAGTLDGWQSEIAAKAPGNSRLVIALCAGFVGPILSFAAGEGGGLHLRGKSSTGKSTALEAAASIWGAPSFVRQWRATSNGLEGIAELANDTLLVLDELAQLDSREAGTVAYLLANGTGKSRAGQSGEARTARRWQTFFLSSGEISLAEHARSDGRGKRSPAGQDIRILDIEADAGAGFGLFDKIAGGHRTSAEMSDAIKASAKKHYGHAGPAFVQALIGQEIETGQTVKQGITGFVTDTVPAGASGQVYRAARRFGLLGMAGEVATHLGIVPWQTGEALTAAKRLFAEWIQARGGAGDAEAEAALEQVVAFLTLHGASRFQPIDGDARTVVPNRAGFMRQGQEGTEYLIPPTAWTGEVCAGINAKVATATLAERGHLVTDAKGKTSIPVTVAGMGKARFYVIRQSIFGSSSNA